MNDIAQIDLADAPQVDWKDFEGSKWVAPPPALDEKDQPIVYYGKAGAVTIKANDYAVDDATGKHLLNYALDPFTISQGPFSGFLFRFVEVNVKPFPKTTRHSLGTFLRAAGVTAKPQTNDEYKAAMNLAAPKQVGFTTDWVAKNKETGEQIKGYLAFPLDPERPGQRKAILKAGDFYNVLDAKGKPTGQQAQVKSDVLFANSRVKYFRDVVK